MTFNLSVYSFKSSLKLIKNEWPVCGEDFDSNVHMLLKCRDVKNSWLDVQSRIQQLWFADFTSIINKIIMGDLESHHTVINLIFN